MEQKELMQELQRRLHIDRQQCAMLLAALERVMADMAIEMQDAGIKGLGRFVSHKHPEYIGEHPETGEQVLYPPRFTYRMQADAQTESDAVLNAALARSAGVDEPVASAFVDALGLLLAERLAAHDTVEIQGLGIFRIVTSHQGDRVAYVPDDRMQHLVNAPFDCFSPVVISEAEEAVAETEQPAEPEIEETEFEVPAPVAAALTPQPEQSAEESPVTPETPPAEETPDGQEAEDTPRTANLTSPQESVVSEGTRTASRTAERPVRPMIRRRTFPVWGSLLIIALLLVCIGVIVWLINRTDKLPEIQQPATPWEAPVAVEPAGQEVVEPTVDEPASEETVQAASEMTSATAAVPASGESEAPSSATAETASAPEGEMLLKDADGKPITARLAAGERLTLLALSRYGDKVFWGYIYKVNAHKLDNPNNVPVGVDLYLPDPNYWKIDASDAASQRRARQLNADLLNAQ